MQTKPTAKSFCFIREFKDWSIIAEIATESKLSHRSKIMEYIKDYTAIAIYNNVSDQVLNMFIEIISQKSGEKISLVRYDKIARRDGHDVDGYNNRGRVAVLVDVGFRKRKPGTIGLAARLARHVGEMNPGSVEEMMVQKLVGADCTVGEYIKGIADKDGIDVWVESFVRYETGMGERRDN